MTYAFQIDLKDYRDVSQADIRAAGERLGVVINEIGDGVFVHGHQPVVGRTRLAG